MSEAAQDAWFYTREGTRHGPVTYPELQALAVQGDLNPRLDMAWHHGMSEWQLAGEIEGLFERRPTAAAADSLGTPYQTPSSQSSTDWQRHADQWPGARRRSFLTATVLVPLAWQVLFGGSATILSKYIGPEMMVMVAAAAPFVLLALAIHYGLLRLVNLGMSRWWYLANLVPVLNLWIAYRCFACPAGYAYHKKLDGIGVALAVFYWLMLVLCLLAIAAAIFFVVRMAGDTALPQQLNEMLNALRDQATHKP